MSKYIIFIFFIFNIVITDNTNKIYHISSQNIYGVNLSSQGNFYIISTSYIFEITRQLYINKITSNTLYQLNKPLSIAMTLSNSNEIVLFQSNTIYSFQPLSGNQPTQQIQLTSNSITSPSILIDDNKIFNCIKDAADFYNISSHAIVNNCRKKSKTCAGYHFEYV